MQAIIKTGGQQFRVAEGTEIYIDLLKDIEKGADISFDQVLMIYGQTCTKIGTPVVEGASVTGKVLDVIKGPKTRAVFHRRRKDSKTVRGGRQQYLHVKITSIKV